MIDIRVAEVEPTDYHICAAPCMTTQLLKHHISHVRSTVYGACQNSTLHNFVLLQLIITKLGMIDYVGDPNSDANFR